MPQLDVLHVRAQNRLQRVVGRQIARIVATVPIDRRDQKLRDAYATAAARLIAGGQLQAAKLALAYIAAYVPPVEPPSLQVINLITPTSMTAGAGLEQLLSLVDQGVDEAQAREQAGVTAGAMAENVVQISGRAGLDEGARAAHRQPRWRLEPNAGACGWCQFIASTGARYLSAESVPVPHGPNNPRHGGGPCGCTPAPQF